MKDKDKRPIIASHPPPVWLPEGWPDDIYPPRHSLVFVLSGPSGVGKDTIINLLKAESFPIHHVVTMTTRPRRAREIDGSCYHFVNSEQFGRLRDRGALLEWANVHGYWYGTPVEGVRQAIMGGEDALLKIDVQGAAEVKRRIPQAVLIFLGPPGRKSLLRRLARRGTETPEDLDRRIRNADDEIRRVVEYDYVVVNRDSQSASAAAAVKAIITAERLRVFSRQVSI